MVVLSKGLSSGTVL